MIARLWRGWTAVEEADAYEALLRGEILPGITALDILGYRGGHVLRRDSDDEVEFLTVLWFEDLDAVRSFAGTDHESAVVPPRARELLTRFDTMSRHYEVVREPGAW